MVSGVEVANMSPGEKTAPALCPLTQTSEWGLHQLNAWNPGPGSAEWRVSQTLRLRWEGSWEPHWASLFLWPVDHVAKALLTASKSRPTTCDLGSLALSKNRLLGNTGILWLRDLDWIANQRMAPERERAIPKQHPRAQTCQLLGSEMLTLTYFVVCMFLSCALCLTVTMNCRLGFCFAENSPTVKTRLWHK